MAEEVSADEGESPSGLHRRELLKKSIMGAGVAGVVWAGPRIDGLSLRPDYAAAASAGGTTFAFTMGPILGNSYSQTLPFAGGNVTGTWNGTGSGGALVLDFTGAPNCGFTAINSVNSTPADNSSNGAPPVITPGQVVVAHYGSDDLIAPGGNISGTITCT